MGIERGSRRGRGSSVGGSRLGSVAAPTASPDGGRQRYDEAGHRWPAWSSAGAAPVAQLPFSLSSTVPFVHVSPLVSTLVPRAASAAAARSSRWAPSVGAALRTL